MANSRTSLRATIKSQYMEKLIAFLADQEDVGITGTNEFNFPVVDSEGNEDFIVVKVSIPTGSRDGDAYDGYGARTDWELKQKQNAEKAEKKAAEKARKMERDAKARAKKAAQ